MLRVALSSLLLVPVLAVADAPAKRSARDALQPFNDFIGEWRATGSPVGTREEVQKGFWTEGMDWAWKFKGEDAWLKVRFDKGKHFRTGELHYLPAEDRFRLTLETKDKQTLTFKGPLEGKVLTLERKDEAGKETQRLVFTLLHSNRFLYRYEVRPEGKQVYRVVWKVGSTKEGVPFAAGDGRPECVVSGGLGTMPVSYQGKTYYVCCSGCRDEFNANPARYVKEFEAKKAKQK
jgi:hypothetical protein